MAMPRLSTIQTWAVFSVITLVAVARADNPQSPQTPSWPVTDPMAAGCASELNKIQDAAAAIQALCLQYSYDNNNPDSMKKCIKERLLLCDKAAQETGNNILSADDKEGADETDCDKIIDVSRKCEGVYSVTPDDALKNRKEIRSLRDDLRKERQDARKNDSEKLKQNQEDANKLMDEANKNDQDWAKQRKELNDKLQEMLKGISADSMKVIKDMQNQLDQIDMEYIKYRDALRRKISLANDTELTWNTQCRVAANDAGNQAEAELNKRIEAETAMVRNFRFTSLTGQLRRNLKIKRQRILNKYNETLAKCLRGDAEPGASLKLKLSQAKNDIRDSTAEANDKAARLEKLRGQIAENVNSMAQTLSQERQQAILSNQQDLQLLDQAHTANQQRMQQRQQQMVQNQWRDDLERMQAQNELNQRLNDLMGDEALASAEYRCWRKLSKERSEQALGDRQKAQLAFGLLSIQCKKDPQTKAPIYKSLVCPNINKTNPDASAICASVVGAKEETKQGSIGDGSSDSTSDSAATPTTPRVKGSSDGSTAPHGTAGSQPTGASH